MNRLLKAVKANRRSNIVKIKFGAKITRDHKEAIMFDHDNGNTNWKDADILELKKIYNFDNFESLGTVNKACIPPGHTNTMGGIRHSWWTLVIWLDPILTLTIIASSHFVPCAPLSSYMDWILLIHILVTSVTLTWIHALRRRLYSITEPSLHPLEMPVYW